MTDLNELIRHEISNLARFFARPLNLHKMHGLKEAPIVVRFGPDIESLVSSKGRNILKDSRGLPFLLTVQEQFMRTDLLWQDPRHSSVVADNGRVEIRLAPKDIRPACTAYFNAQAIVMDVSTRAAFETTFGNGDWHVSLVQKDLDILQRSGARLGCLQPFADSLVALQRLVPAFFVKPSMAELPYQDGAYRCPKFFMYRMADIEASVRWGNRRQPASTIESRLAAHAPYTPVYLTLLAIHKALTGKGVSLARSGAYDPGVDERLLRTLRFDQRMYNSAIVTRGPCGYLMMLHETIRNHVMNPVLPRTVFDGMLTRAFDDYEAWLASPSAKATYQPHIINAIGEAANRLRSANQLAARMLDPPSPLPYEQNRLI